MSPPSGTLVCSDLAGIVKFGPVLKSIPVAHKIKMFAIAGNVPLFTPKGTEGALVAGCARHVVVDGALVAGFQLDRGYSIDAYDRCCEGAGLTLSTRYATWDREPWSSDSAYAVSVHRRTAN